MATINIIIKGIAICYQKEIEGKKLWRVLFPFNDCHSVKFSYDKGSGEVFVGHLGKAKSRVEIVPEAENRDAGATEKFQKTVLDLTADTASIKTHSKISLKDKWDKRGILLTIPSVVFDVRKTLLDFCETRDLDIFIHNPADDSVQILYTCGNSSAQIDIAHSIKGEISLEAGITLSVKTDDNIVFTVKPDTDYTLIFDNDCKEVTTLPDGSYKNDMEMIYELLEEPEHTDHKFLVKGEGNPVEPPDLLRGKPCLVVKVSDPTSIESLP